VKPLARLHGFNKGQSAVIWRTTPHQLTLAACLPSSNQIDGALSYRSY
jgi:hypothetical protein